MTLAGISRSDEIVLLFFSDEKLDVYKQRGRFFERRSLVTTIATETRPCKALLGAMMEGSTPVNLVIEHVTDRIIKRSARSRGDYLATACKRRRAKDRRAADLRAAISPHGFAASGTADKQALKTNVVPNIRNRIRLQRHVECAPAVRILSGHNQKSCR